MSNQPTRYDPLAAARRAQPQWAGLSVTQRLAMVGRLRGLIAEQPERLLQAIAAHAGRVAAEALTSQIIPLADAGLFLEREAARLLAPQRLGSRGRPLWLFGARAEIRREPCGVVLIIAPGNYPLFLPGVQMLQALVAGNAVLVKPAPGCSPGVIEFGRLLVEAGLPPALCYVLDENADAAKNVIVAGVDKVALTGGASTGCRLLADLASYLTPAILELSGSGAVYVLPGADLELVAAALAFGLGLNGGATCIAPRRVFVPKNSISELEAHLLHLVAGLPAVSLTESVKAEVIALLSDALARGARLSGEPPCAADAAMDPIIVSNARPAFDLLKADIMAPVLALIAVDSTEQALTFDAVCPYALSAAIFGPEQAALELANRVQAGSVTINDLIVPTADARLPFGGRGESGYGVTRGGAGLLEFTRIKTVSVRRGHFRPHYDVPTPSDQALFTTYLRAVHGRGFKKRLSNLAHLLRCLRTREG